VKRRSHAAQDPVTHEALECGPNAKPSQPPHLRRVVAENELRRLMAVTAARRFSQPSLQLPSSEKRTPSTIGISRQAHFAHPYPLSVSSTTKVCPHSRQLSICNPHLNGS
jgi:hypothetical protein